MITATGSRAGAQGAPRTDWQAGGAVVVAALIATGAVLVDADVRIEIATGVASTAALVVLSVAAQRSTVLAGARDAVLAFAALSVFPWVSAAVLAVPAVAGWVASAPVAVAFGLINALKLSSVVVLWCCATRAGWTRDRLLLRTGDLRARSFLPRVPWPVLGPVVALVVAALFVTTTPGLHGGRTHLLILWSPVMLVGAVVNAVCEELLYRHALVTAAQRVFGVAGAVVLSSAVFGVAHLHGTPGGLSGVAYTFCFGAVCAAAMLQTRGAGWNVAIHVCGDLAAVATLVLAS